MKSVITSKNGKCEAVIIQTMSNGYRVSLWQIINTGIGIEKDFLTSKGNFANYDSAKRWSLANM